MPRRRPVLTGYPSAPRCGEKAVRIPVAAYQTLKLIQQERPPVDRRKYGSAVHPRMRTRYPLSWIVREAVELLRATELAERPAPVKRYRTS